MFNNPTKYGICLRSEIHQPDCSDTANQSIGSTFKTTASWNPSYEERRRREEACRNEIDPARQRLYSDDSTVFDLYARGRNKTQIRALLDSCLAK